MNKRIKIVLVLFLSFCFTLIIINYFYNNSPIIKTSLISKLWTIRPSPTSQVQPAWLYRPNPTIIINRPTPVNKVIIIPTTILTPIKKPTITPTKKPTFTPTFFNQPTIDSNVNCPISSTNHYSSLATQKPSEDLPVFNPENNPEINLRLRGFGLINKSTGFIPRNNSYGLDNQMPPQISSLFGNNRPQISRTYSVYEWDFTKNISSAPLPASPNYEVTMIGLIAQPNQKLLGLKAGRSIGDNNVFMVLWATKNDIVFTHSDSNTLMGGYLYYFLDICVDPNLLTQYQVNNSSGRTQLPVISTGQIFGYASNTDIKVVVRDTMSFMDLRYNQDWWDYGE